MKNQTTDLGMQWLREMRNDASRALPHALSVRTGAGGFTIIEVVMVLAIIVLMAGIAMPAMSSMILGEQLRAPARELEAMAVAARSDALARQRPYQIVINANGFHLECPARGKEPSKTEELPKFLVASGVSINLATWPEEKWETPKGFLWYFPPSGLCDPIRIAFRKGDSYFTQKYSAVTGWNQDETFFIQ